MTDSAVVHMLFEFQFRPDGDWACTVAVPPLGLATVYGNTKAGVFRAAALLGFALHREQLAGGGLGTAGFRDDDIDDDEDDDLEDEDSTDDDPDHLPGEEPPKIELSIMIPRGAERGFCWWCTKPRAEVRKLIERAPDPPEVERMGTAEEPLAWPAICLDCATAAVKLATRPEDDGSGLDG